MDTTTLAELSTLELTTADTTSIGTVEMDTIGVTAIDTETDRKFTTFIPKLSTLTESTTAIPSSTTAEYNSTRASPNKLATANLQIATFVVGVTIGLVLLLGIGIFGYVRWQRRRGSVELPQLEMIDLRESTPRRRINIDRATFRPVSLQLRRGSGSYASYQLGKIYQIIVIKI